MNYNSLDEMYRVQLRVLYGAEFDSTELYASIGSAATDPRISSVALSLLGVSEACASQLADLLDENGLMTRGVVCEYFDSLVLDCDDMHRKTSHSEMRDIGLASMLLRVEYYKVVGYDITQRWAGSIGIEMDRGLLATLRERHRVEIARIERTSDALHQTCQRAQELRMSSQA